MRCNHKKLRADHVRRNQARTRSRKASLRWYIYHRNEALRGSPKSLRLRRITPNRFRIVWQKVYIPTARRLVQLVRDPDLVFWVNGRFRFVLRPAAVRSQIAQRTQTLRLRRVQFGMLGLGAGSSLLKIGELPI